MNAFDVGDVVRCNGVFTNAAGTTVDPGTVTFKVRDPSGDVTTYVYGTDIEVVRTDTGTYHLDVTVDESGTWRYTYVGTGVNACAGEQAFFIVQSEFD